MGQAGDQGIHAQTERRRDEDAAVPVAGRHLAPQEVADDGKDVYHRGGQADVAIRQVRH